MKNIHITFYLYYVHIKYIKPTIFINLIPLLISFDSGQVQLIIMWNPFKNAPSTSKPKYQHLLTLLISLILLNLAWAQQQQYAQTRPESGENVQYLANDRISKTDQQRLDEQKELSQYYRLSQIQVTQQFAFEITNQFEEFHFHLPADHVVQLISRVYVLKNNAYVQVANIEEEPAVNLVVYENNHRIVVEKSFYFQSVIKINGKSGSTYMIRFFSPSPKLLIIRHNNFIQISAFEGKVKSTQMQQNSLRIAATVNKLNQIFKNLRFTYRLQLEQKKQFTNTTESFSSFQIVEMVMLIVVSFLQVKIVSKLFKIESII